MGSGRTLDDLWKSLGLDSLPPDAGTAADLNQTRLRDWEVDTLRSGEHEDPTAPRRDDLPKLSLSPPAKDGQGAPTEFERDMVVTGVLGEGGMGRVLLARQGSLGRDVAVKVTRASASAGAINALLHEAQTSGSLEHPGIVPVYSLGSDAEGRPAIVMKRVDGVSWSMLLRNAEDPAWKRVSANARNRLDASVEILRQVSNAIAFAHNKGVLHRDLKPSNVLIGEFGEVYVADWGIAIRKVLAAVREPDGKVEASIARKPSLVGSPVYLAPEMCSGEDTEMDERTDVFLLGATLYELLTGTPPWSGPDLYAVLRAAHACQPKPPPPTAPRELVEICARAMARKPEERFQTALEFRDALGGYLRHRGSVELAAAAGDRLGTLLATLASTEKERIYPLLSECRFGFTQALEEWPDNEFAQQGLARCLQATASHELSIGHVDAARALIAELEFVPDELKEQLAAAEEKEKQDARTRARMEHLSRQFDPSVAIRQRVLAFTATTVFIVLVIVSPYVFPEFHERMAHSRWYLSGLMGVVSLGFLAAVFIWRRYLLSTRLNRRIIGMVGVAAFGTQFQRIVAAVQNIGVRDTVLQNGVLVVVVCVTGGITLHKGFYYSALPMLAGLLINLFVHGHEAQIFGAAAIVSLAVAVLSWRGWRGEANLN
ncbi:MAG: serine/threonine protein kinase [Archangium sp.]|nr:serine/threonine protein kinase [Archangium sp.]